jgi:hypothetical protein
MKHDKKAEKKDKLKTKAKAKAPASQELSEDQLEHVAGGAVDTFLKIDGIQGESTDHKTPGTELSSFVAPNPTTVQYKP